MVIKEHNGKEVMSLPLFCLKKKTLLIENGIPHTALCMLKLLLQAL